MAKKSTTKTVETLTHEADKRKNIPTAEYQSVVKPEEQKPLEKRYPRNTDLDPQLVWRGKDEQDWSDLVVHALPLYIQEKVHPKVLIDDLLCQTKANKAQEPGFQTVLFADFNGMPKDADKTDFYQHDQNWSNRMILGDSLQVMASPPSAKDTGLKRWPGTKRLHHLYRGPLRTGKSRSHHTKQPSRTRPCEPKPKRNW